MMELVDFNDSMLEAKESKSKSKSGSKRTRRGKKTETAAPAAKAAEKKVEETTAEVVEETPVVEEASAAKADDLTKIEGIGPKMAGVFNDAGIDSFKVLSGKTADELKAILDAAEGNFAAHDPGTWPEQATMAADGKWDELKKWQDELDGGN
jgi:predicted flap endonuclease-1-like 5' DNA nuclease